jgi:hypothetical protein
MAFFIVGVTARNKRLAVCANEDQAAEYISSLPYPEDGIYYIAECDQPVELAEMTLDDLPDPEEV